MGSLINDLEADLCGSSVRETVKAIESGRLPQLNECIKSIVNATVTKARKVSELAVFLEGTGIFSTVGNECRAQNSFHLLVFFFLSLLSCKCFLPAMLPTGVMGFDHLDRMDEDKF